ncbi:MAG: hypothetical protein OR995_05430 [Candidatus Nanopelagicales bacterium]|nr:hypothetical protein [Candidatus Nanopelagicales bacterium]
MTTLARGLAVGGSFLTAQALSLWALLGPVSNADWTKGFRAYFSNDQLSYAAIAVNSSQSIGSSAEPLTGTGVSFYPSGWYHFLGLVNNVTGVPINLLWQVLGLAAIGIAIAILGLIAHTLSRRWWAPILPGLALFTGTLSTFIHDYWYTSLSAHAVIWGPFGTLFTLNSGAIALMSGTVALALILWHLLAPSRSNTRIFIAAALIGLLANLHTYAFFTTASFAAAFITLTALITAKSRRRTVLVIAATGLVLVFGNPIAALIGPLPLFALLLLVAAIAAYPFIKSNLHTTFSLIALAGIAASPQVIRTLLGIASQDEFLAYRQGSSLDLGVPLIAAAVAAVPLILFAIYILFVSRVMPGQSQEVIYSFFAATAIGAVIMSTNDLWGFNQEPYRFWLQYSIITGFLISILLAYALSFQQKRTGLAVLVVAVLLWLISLADFAGFFSYAREQGVLPTQDSRALAIQELTKEIPSGSRELILSSRCTDPQLLKLITSRPVAFFNYGLAWPDNREEVRDLSEHLTGNTLIGLQAAQVGYVITDSNCDSDWAYTQAGINIISITPYDSGALTLWRVTA